MWPVPRRPLAGIREAAVGWDPRGGRWLGSARRPLAGIREAAAAACEAPETAAEGRAAAHGSGRSRPGPRAAARLQHVCPPGAAVAAAPLAARCALLLALVLAALLRLRGARHRFML
ncbi:uncharacterized protein LOC144374356 [Ictidomys tridecemlineatus]